MAVQTVVPISIYSADASDACSAATANLSVIFYSRRIDDACGSMWARKTLVSLKEIRVLYLTTAICLNAAAIPRAESLSLNLNAYMNLLIERDVG